MKKGIIILIVIIFSIISGIYLLISSEIKNLFNSSINQSTPKFRTEKVEVENEIKKLSDFTKVEISYSISGKLNKNEKKYDFENFVVVYLDKKNDFKKNEILELGPKINNIISKNIINIETYKMLKIVFMDTDNDKFNNSKSRNFNLKIKT